MVKLKAVTKILFHNVFYCLHIEKLQLSIFYINI